MKLERILLILAVLGVALLVLHLFVPQRAFGAVDTSCKGYTTCMGDLYLSTAFGASGSLQTAGTLIAGAAATLNGLTTFNAGEVYAFTNSTSTVATSQTLSVGDVQGYDTVILTPNTGNLTLTFFASSSASTWLPTAGNRQKTCFVNGTTTANTFITFAGGTGVNLQVASSSGATLGSTKLAPQKVGCFEFVRANSTATTFDIQAAYTAYQ